MDNQGTKARISTFELFIAFANCVVWCAGVYFLRRIFQEKRHLEAIEAERPRAPFRPASPRPALRPRSRRLGEEYARWTDLSTVNDPLFHDADPENEEWAAFEAFIPGGDA